MSSKILDQMRKSFQFEALELLAELDTALLTLEADPGQDEVVHRVFRAIHTIKGSGAMAGFAHLAAFAHKVEEVFDLARAGRLPVSPELIDCGLKSSDVLRSILQAPASKSHESGALTPAEPGPAEQTVLDALAKLMPHSSGMPNMPLPPAFDSPQITGRAAYEVSIRPRNDFFYSGNDPITLLDELRGLGQAHITADAGGVPLFAVFDPEQCYLSWTLKLVTEVGESAIRGIFSFVEEECAVEVRLMEEQSSAVALLGSIPAESLDLFAVECQERLEEVDLYTLQLETDGSAQESLNAVFRAVHSIKGNAGLLLGQLPSAALSTHHPLTLLARVAHALESILDSFRQNGGKAVDAATIALTLKSRDAMESLLQSLVHRLPKASVAPSLLTQLGIEAPAAVAPHPLAAAPAFRNTASQCLDIFEACLASIGRGEAGRPVLKTYQRGLKTLASAAAYQKRPDLDAPVAEQLRILEAAMQASDPLSPQDLERLTGAVRITRARIESPEPEIRPAAVVHSSTAAEPKSPPAPSRTSAGTHSAAAATIRIDQEKLDRLMQVVGELLIARGAIPTLVGKLQAGEDRQSVARGLKEAGAGISHIAEELQASVMSIRMLPVKTVFQRFPRLVRDLAQNLGKEVHLVVEGDSVELDKTILEQIGDPLVHLVRNSVDHGIERPEERRRRGKEAAGRVVLRASNEAGNVVIEVEDDGKGLDQEALKRKAVERGLITPEAAAAMTSVEAYRLVFLPGLSTAEKVTDVSGRGVGMDVVSNNIRGLQGSIDISSQAGAGTVFSIKLPTSLIISKGILLEAGGQEYILSLSSICDMVKVPARHLHSYNGCQIMQVRGEVFSVFSLAEMFGLPHAAKPEVSIAIVQSGKRRFGLLVDRFVSEVEVLVKPLAGGLKDCREFHGAAIMNDGRVVLVLNPLECHQITAESSLEAVAAR